MEKKVKIAVSAMEFIPWRDLTIIQGDLKELSKADYERFKQEILDLDFSEALGVWKDDGKNKVLSGTQRVRVVSRMEEEGYEIPALPCNIVEAKNLKEAKRKILALAKVYGKMTLEGLHEFAHDIDYEDSEKLMAGISNLPGIDGKVYLETFYENDPGDISAIEEPVDPISGITNAGQSHVKMVQLFLNDSNHPVFIAHVTALAGKYGTDNLTDTVLEAIKREHDNPR